MKELSSLITGFTGNRNHEKLNETIIGNFSLDNGKEKLKRHFKKIETRKYEDSLRITESKPLVDYIFSLNGVIEGLEIVPMGCEKELLKYVDKLLSEKGYIYIEKEAGTFICEKSALDSSTKCNNHYSLV